MVSKRELEQKIRRLEAHDYARSHHIEVANNRIDNLRGLVDQLVNELGYEVHFYPSGYYLKEASDE